MNIKKHLWLYIASFAACILLIFDISIIATLLTNSEATTQPTQATDIEDVIQDTADDLFGEEKVLALTGRYLHSGGEEEFIANELVPQLILNDDNTFILNENKDKFMNTILGEYTQENQVLTLYVQSSNTVVEDVIIFEVLNDNTIVLTQDLYSSKTDAQFILN